MKSSSKRSKRTFFPRRTFEHDLYDFVQFAKRERWQFSGIDFEQLLLDANNQSNERAEIDALETRLASLRDSFAIAQEQRYRRFIAALNAARAAFQSDHDVMEWLARYKNSTGTVKPGMKREARLPLDS